MNLFTFWYFTIYLIFIVSNISDKQWRLFKERGWWFHESRACEWHIGQNLRDVISDVINLLGTFQLRRGLRQISLILEQKCVLENCVRHQVGVGLQLARVGHHLEEAFFRLQRRVHVLQTHPAKQLEEAQVLWVVLVGVWNGKSGVKISIWPEYRMPDKWKNPKLKNYSISFWTLWMLFGNNSRHSKTGHLNTGFIRKVSGFRMA